MPPPMHSVARPFLASRLPISIQQGGQDARARRADGMADGDGAAIDVHLGRIPAHVLVDGAGLGGEGFIGFHQVQIGGLPARLLQRLARGRDGAGAHHLGIDAGLRPAGDARQRRQAAGGGVLGAHQHQGGGAVIEADGIAGGDGAVLVEGRAQARHRLDRWRRRGYIRRYRPPCRPCGP